MTEQRIVMTTIGSKGEAEDMAWELVERKVAACVNIIEMQGSIFRWQGEVKSEKECLLLIKSSRARFDALREAIEKLHSYAVPEVLALPIVAGAPNYLTWLAESLGSGE